MQIIRPRQTAEKCGIALPTLWRWAKDDPDFPKPVKIVGITGWVESELNAYLEKKVQESRDHPTKRKSAFAAAKVSAQVRRENSEKVAA